jgi:hypothetical protein
MASPRRASISGGSRWACANTVFFDCAERIFLRKVGGGYIFIHRLLMEHFAELKQRTKE